jgi:hypothetical protein
MCGRFALTATPDAVQELLATLDLEDFPARYNIAPTQPILAVIEGERPERGSNLPARHALLLRWGFMPGWVKDPKEFPLLINARAETAIGKASFRAAMRPPHPHPGIRFLRMAAAGKGFEGEEPSLLGAPEARRHRGLCRADGDVVFGRRFGGRYRRDPDGGCDTRFSRHP